MNVSGRWILVRVYLGQHLPKRLSLALSPHSLFIFSLDHFAVVSAPTWPLPASWTTTAKERGLTSCKRFSMEVCNSKNPQGNHEYSDAAKACIRQNNTPVAATHFVACGTLANIICIASCLRPHEAVIAANPGYDSVAQEDLGRPISDLAPELVWFREQTEALNLTIPNFFHAGETLGDGNSTDDNLFDALLRSSKMSWSKCPISKEVLRLNTDILHHPLPAMIAHGIPTAISNDNPAILGQDVAGLSYDFFEAIQAFDNLGLAGLGALAQNSLQWENFEDQSNKGWIQDIDRVHTFEIGKSPPYLAISHTWSDKIFPKQLPLDASFGGDAIKQTLMKRGLDSVKYCWVDLFSIEQDSEDDMNEQIPLMGQIFGNAEAVLIILTNTLGLTQELVDYGTAQLDEALAIWETETWTEDGARQYWKFGKGRTKLVQAIEILSRFAKTAWGTRIWTLQEYLLARNVLWIGSDLEPITINDVLFIAIPRLCDEFELTECTVGEVSIHNGYSLVSSYFSGMAASRLRFIERTRVMELLGNRQATVPVDEVVEGERMEEMVRGSVDSWASKMADASTQYIFSPAGGRFDMRRGSFFEAT
ncbi:HET domain protein [Penicillium sp. IBT 35674x]|nr:HET domain protein [Penicillium sp. IBT 35674x]